ncbi:hypothetical protein DRN73_07360 [Candidatus Pacearchaeota archaeon]|nr:MAG: hypothetical protein DRN73_07360 [Candidatus Pacearchaeota archaeon]
MMCLFLFFSLVNLSYRFLHFCSEINSIQVEGSNLIVGLKNGFEVYDLYSKDLKYSYFTFGEVKLVVYDVFTNSFFYLKNDSVFNLWWGGDKGKFILYKEGILSIGVDSKYLYIHLQGQVLRYFKNGVYNCKLGEDYKGAVIWVGEKVNLKKEKIPFLAPYFNFYEKYLIFYPYREKILVGTDIGRILVFNSLTKRKEDSIFVCQNPLHFWDLGDYNYLKIKKMCGEFIFPVFAFVFLNQVFIFTHNYLFFGKNNFYKRFLTVEFEGFNKFGERVFLYGKSGLYEFYPESKDFKKVLNFEIKKSVIFDTLFFILGFDSKVYVYNPEVGKMRRFYDERGWLLKVFDFYKHLKELWFLTDQGIVRYSESGFYYFPYFFSNPKFLIVKGLKIYLVSNNVLYRIDLYKGKKKKIFDFGKIGLDPLQIRFKEGKIKKIYVYCKEGIVEIND